MIGNRKVKKCKACGTGFVFGSDIVCVKCQSGFNPHDCKSDGHRIKWNITFGKCLECGKVFENEYNAGLELSDLA